MCKGTVRWFDDGDGCGVISPDSGGTDLSVQDVDIRGNSHYKSLEEGQRVLFDTEQGPDGVSAVNVTTI